MTDHAHKTRFAPSPTGRVHLGNVRTALFNYLLAHQHGGQFLLRFEDTDQERSRTEYAEAMMQDLRWLGLDWQEGPEAGGEQGPYYQAQRVSIYDNYYQQLQDQGRVYPCFCTPEELSLARKAQRAAGQAPRYPGTCARLSEHEAEARRAQGRAPTLRFRVPDEGEVTFDDLVRGPQQLRCADIGDFIIRRSDGTPAFFFTNALDDALMGVDVVLRGEDHLTNTPRQLMILEALGLSAPRYGHTSLIVGPDGSPLSKRHGSRNIEALRDEGVLPQAIVNYLARLGHHYNDDQLMDLTQLAREFRLAHLGRAPARFEFTQLHHWQKEALKHLDDEAFWQWVSQGEGQPITTLVPDAQRNDFIRAVRANIEQRSDGVLWAQAVYAEALDFDEKARAVIADAGPEFYAHAQTCVQEAEDFRAFSKAVGSKAGVKGKALFMPLRVALTGATHGPEMANLWSLWGAGRIVQRLQAAAELTG